MTTVHRHVGAARSHLVEAGVPPDEAACDAEVLARSVLGWDRATYLLRGRVEAPSEFAHHYAAMLTRRARREPVSLITGQREFWGLDFEVTKHVLTPRPETELLVEEAVARLKHHLRSRPHVVDVGTGSGCVAIAIAREIRHACVTATDISEAALAVARRNADRHGVGDRIGWVCAPLLDGVEDTPDLIVANLPYVPEADIATLAPEVREFEPRVALDGGPDGLGTIRRLVDEARHQLTSGGHLILELGAGQATSVMRYVEEQAELVLVRLRDDLQGIPRIAIIQRIPCPEPEA